MSRVGIRRSILLFVVLLAVGQVLSARPPFEQPVNPATGHINGQVAISFWPFVDTLPEGRLDPQGFTVRMVPESDMDHEFTYPCGEWFQPPPGKYKFWMEADGWMSPFSSVMRFRGGPFVDRGGVSEGEVVPAGKVHLAQGTELDAETVVRLLHLDSHWTGQLKKEMSRRVVGAARHEAIRMPAGPVLAALHDRRSDTYLALSRPVTVPIKGTVSPEFTAPAPGQTHLVVVVERAKRAMTATDDDVTPVVFGPGTAERHPDVLIPTVDRLYAVWYDLTGPYVGLRVTSAHERLAAQEIALRAGKIESFRGQLVPLPSLEVGFELPILDGAESLSLVVSDAQTWGPVRQARVTPTESSLIVPHLPADVLWVSLTSGPWTWFEKVDLRDGADASVLFHPQPILLHGTVSYGSEGHPATITFRTNPRDPTQELEVRTDGEGAYKTALFRPGRYIIRVRLDGVDGPPFLEVPEERIRSDRQLDFKVPAGQHRVHVVDADSGEGIEAALLSVDNHFGDPERTVSQPAETDADGRATLPPLRPGQVTLIAKARGYFPGEPVTAEILEGADALGLQIELRSAAADSNLRVVLANGQPARGAEVRIMRSLDANSLYWEGIANNEGTLEVPDGAQDEWFLLGRHPLGGSFVHRYFTALNAGVVRMPPQRTPTRVYVTDARGDAARGAQLALWIDGMRLSGASLAWFADSWSSGTDISGHWQTQRLPATPLRLLGFSNGARVRALSGLLDPLATAVGTAAEGEVIELTRAD